MYSSGGQKPDMDLAGLNSSHRQGWLLQKAREESPFPRLFQSLGATCIPSLLVPSSKASKALKAVLLYHRSNANCSEIPSANFILPFSYNKHLPRFREIRTWTFGGGDPHSAPHVQLGHKGLCDLIIPWDPNLRGAPPTWSLVGKSPARYLNLSVLNSCHGGQT